MDKNDKKRPFNAISNDQASPKTNITELKRKKLEKDASGKTDDTETDSP